MHRARSHTTTPLAARISARRPLLPALLALVALVALFALVAPVSRSSAATAHRPRSITIVNRTDETIWVAATPASLAGVSGWKLSTGRSLTIHVSDRFNGRIWGRTGCRFGSGGRGHCQTGDCGDRLQCTGGGQVPATLAEFNLDAWRHIDFYDVSMVDGSNLPMYINTVGGRTPDRVDSRGCERDRGCTSTVRCPHTLQVRAGGRLIGCISPCARFGTARYCCRGRFAKGCNPARTWPVDYARVFKRAEPYAYSWSGDDATSTFTCTGGCGYRIVFGVTPPRVGGPPG